MTKPDFTDFYKFLASLGTILLSLALIIPWLFLHETFDTQIKATDIAQLTTVAQQLIQYRQTVVLWFIMHIFWISGSMAVFGTLLLVFGLGLWRERQKTLDLKERLETEKLHREVGPLTPSEIAEKALKQLGFSRPNVSPGSVAQSSIGHERLTTSPQFLFAKYLEIHTVLFEKISKYLISNSPYKALSNQRIRNTQEDIDILLLAKSYDPDVIIEIRYFEQSLELDWIKETIGHTVSLAQTYEEETLRKTLPVLLLVSSKSSLPDIQSFEGQLELGVMDSRIQLVSISELEIIQLNGSDIIARISAQILDRIQSHILIEQRKRERQRQLFSFAKSLWYYLLAGIVLLLVASSFIKIWPFLWLGVATLAATLPLMFAIPALILIVTCGLIFWARRNPVRGTIVFSNDRFTIVHFNLYTGWNITKISKRELMLYPDLGIQFANCSKIAKASRPVGRR